MAKDDTKSLKWRQFWKKMLNREKQDSTQPSIEEINNTYNGNQEDTLVLSQRLFDACVQKNPSEVVKLLSNTSIDQNERMKFFAFATKLGMAGYTTANRALISLMKDSPIFLQVQTNILKALKFTFHDRRDLAEVITSEQIKIMTNQIKTYNPTHIFITGYGARYIWISGWKEITAVLGREYDVSVWGGDCYYLGAYSLALLKDKIRREPLRKRIIIGPFTGSWWWPFFPVDNATFNLFGEVPSETECMVFHLGLPSWNTLLETFNGVNPRLESKVSIDVIVGPYSADLTTKEIEALRNTTDDKKKTKDHDCCK